MTVGYIHHGVLTTVTSSLELESWISFELKSYQWLSIYMSGDLFLCIDHTLMLQWLLPALEPPYSHSVRTSFHAHRHSARSYQSSYVVKASYEGISCLRQLKLSI